MKASISVIVIILKSLLYLVMRSDGGSRVKWKTLQKKYVSNKTKRTFFKFKIVWPCIVRDSLWLKPTDSLNSNFIGITTLHVSGSLSAHHQEFLAVHRYWYILCSGDDRLLPGAGWNCSSILLLVANGHHICIKCTKADVGQELLMMDRKAARNM